MLDLNNPEGKQQDLGNWVCLSGAVDGKEGEVLGTQPLKEVVMR